MHSTLNPPLQLQETPNVGGGRAAVLELSVSKKIYSRKVLHSYITL